MDKKDIHTAIMKEFSLSNKTVRTANLPYCSGYRYDRNNLAKLLGELKYNKGAEIGVRKGRYSETLCRYNPNLKLYCIDPWDVIGTKYSKEKQNAIHAIAVNRLSKYNVTFLRKTSIDALADVRDGELDFVYIDGDHHFDVVMLDIIFWSKKVKKNGIIACHDCYGGETGVQKAVEAYTHSHHIDPWYVTKELQPTAYWVNP